MKKYSTDSIPIYAGNMVVGHVRGDTFYKTISASKHFLRQPPAIMFDIQSLGDAERYGALFAHVTNRETGDVYSASIDLIWAKPVYKDYGCGAQVGLCLKDWNINGVPPTKPKARPPATPPSHQLSMFQV